MEFMIAYYGGKKPSSQEEGMEHMKNWKKWIANLGDKIINPGTPFPASMLITKDSVNEDTDVNAMKGFAIINCDSMESAIEIAKSDPFLRMEGTIRLSQMMEMK